MPANRYVRAVGREMKYWATKAHYKYRHSFEIENYRSDIDPLSRASVDPTEIVQYTGRVGRDEVGQVKEDIGSVQSGDWDQHSGRNIAPHLPEELTDFLFAEHIEDSGLYQSLHNRFILGTDWKETQYYEVLETLIDSGYEWHGCTDRDELEKRLAELDQIHQSIQADGYKTQRELRRFSDLLTELSREIVVDRGRDGGFLLVCGRHRLCIAQMLQLDEIPVVNCVYHTQLVDK